MRERPRPGMSTTRPAARGCSRSRPGRTLPRTSAATGRCSGGRSGAGFLIAGFVALLPTSVFNDLFLTGTGGRWQLLENVVIGPLVAVLSFVCSVGNVPLAAVLWGGGISFSGVIAFIYADLIIIPLVLIYGRYYGWRLAALLVSIMFGAMVAAALAVDGIFSGLGLIPEERPSVDSITGRGISWNYTTALNIVFTLVAVGLFWLTMRRGARDPVCGMNVDRGKAETAVHRGTAALLLRARVPGEVRSRPGAVCAYGSFGRPGNGGRLGRVGSVTGGTTGGTGGTCTGKAARAAPRPAPAAAAEEER